MYYQVKHSDSDLNKENGTSGVTREGNILKMQQIDVTKKKHDFSMLFMSGQNIGTKEIK
jgi:hypothetical protein